MIAPGRIGVNALATWSRGVVALLLGFFASRWLIAVLGADGYGVWVLVCSMAGIATIVHGVLASASGRFLAVAVGGNDVQSWYVALVKTHVAVAVVTVFLALPVCFVLVRYALNVPDKWLRDALLAMGAVLLKALLWMANTPNRQLFAAHQNLVEPALWGCLDAMANFAILGWMVMNSGYGLFFYAGVLAIVSLVVEGGLFLRARRVFGKLYAHGISSKSNIVELFRFAGWRFMSDGGTILGLQGSTMLVNSHFGPVATAAVGIAKTVSAHCGSLAESVAQAYEPVFANTVGAARGVRRMAWMACRRLCVAYLMFAIPLAILLEPILRLWLRDVPSGAFGAVRWLLAIGALDVLGRAFYSAVTAGGRVRTLYIGVGLLHGVAVAFAAAYLVVFRHAATINGVFAIIFVSHFLSLVWTLSVYRREIKA